MWEGSLGEKVKPSQKFSPVPCHSMPSVRNPTRLLHRQAECPVPSALRGFGTEIAVKQVANRTQRFGGLRVSLILGAIRQTPVVTFVFLLQRVLRRLVNGPQIHAQARQSSQVNIGLKLAHQSRQSPHSELIEALTFCPDRVEPSHLVTLLTTHIVCHE